MSRNSPHLELLVAAVCSGLPSSLFQCKIWMNLSRTNSGIDVKLNVFKHLTQKPTFIAHSSFIASVIKVGEHFNCTRL